MITIEEVERYGKWGLNLHTVKPGITGLWQVAGRSELTYEERVRLDMRYIRNYSIWLDLQIVFQTVPTRWNGFQVIDGDKHDLRQLDPRGAVGTVIGLTPRGRKAKKDRSGFVVRNEH